MTSHRIAVLVLPGAAPLDVGISAQIFAPKHGLPYELLHCSLAAGPVAGRDGLGFVVEHGPEALDIADTVIVPGYNNPLQPLDQRILDGLRDAAFRGTRMVSICTGAFALAATGILDDRRATTHWSMAPVLAREYPKITVDPGVSTRTFGRRFVEDTGYTPMHWILRARIDLARSLLEGSALSVEQVAARVGLGTGANLRLHFQRILDMTPTEYRRAFGGKLAGSGGPQPAVGTLRSEQLSA